MHSDLCWEGSLSPGAIFSSTKCVGVSGLLGQTTAERFRQQEFIASQFWGPDPGIWCYQVLWGGPRGRPHPMPLPWLLVSASNMWHSFGLQMHLPFLLLCSHDVLLACVSCVCVCAQMSLLHKDTSQLGLGAPPDSGVASSYLISFATILFPKKVAPWGAWGEDSNENF